MKNFPLHTKTAMSIERLIDHKNGIDLSDRMSSRMVQLASFLPQGEFIGWQMKVPTEGLVELETFGGASITIEDLEWIMEATAKKWEEKKVSDPIKKICKENELYHAVLSGELQRRAGFSASENNSLPDAIRLPARFSDMFGKIVQALRVHGGMLRYVVGAADEKECKECKRFLQKAWQFHPSEMDKYLGKPVRLRLMFLLPKKMSMRLKAILSEATGVSIEYAGKLKEEHAFDMWNEPMKNAPVVADHCARILALEPLVLDEVIVGIRSEKKAAKRLLACHDNAVDDRAIKIGHATNTAGMEQEITLTDEDLKRHWQIVGQTGTGKSTMLANTLLDAILKGKGVTFLDPHGETIDVLMRSLPYECLKRMRVIRLGDKDNIVPLSMWNSEDPEECEAAISDLSMLFAEIFDPHQQAIVGARWERLFTLLAKSSIALLGPKASFENLIYLAQYQQNVEKLARSIRSSHPDLSISLSTELGMLDPKVFAEVSSWFVSKFQRLTSVPQLRKVLGSGANAVDFSKRIDTDKVLLIDLGLPNVGVSAARIFGTLILQQLWAAIKKRKNRDRMHIIALDEAHLFQHNPLPQMFSEGRKFGIGMIIAHQHCEQLSSAVRESLDANSANFSAFRLSTRDAVHAHKKFNDDRLQFEICALDAFHSFTTISVEGKQTPVFTLKVDKPIVEENGDHNVLFIEKRSNLDLVRPHRDKRPLTISELQHILDTRGASVAEKDSEHQTWDSNFLNQWLKERREKRAQREEEFRKIEDTEQSGAQEEAKVKDEPCPAIEGTENESTEGELWDDEFWDDEEVLWEGEDDEFWDEVQTPIEEQDQIVQ